VVNPAEPKGQMRVLPWEISLSAGKKKRWLSEWQHTEIDSEKSAEVVVAEKKNSEGLNLLTTRSHL
jgi:hypothetical protein